jgi:hypothetical protein
VQVLGYILLGFYTIAVLINALAGESNREVSPDAKIRGRVIRTMIFLLTILYIYTTLPLSQ